MENLLKNLSDELCDELLNKIDNKGNTPLTLASKLAHSHENYKEIIKCLLFYGANPNTRDFNGWSVLDEAVSQVKF